MKNIKLLAYLALSLAMVILMIAILVISIFSYPLNQEECQVATKHAVTALEDRILPQERAEKRKNDLQPIENMLSAKKEKDKTFVFK